MNKNNVGVAFLLFIIVSLGFASQQTRSEVMQSSCKKAPAFVQKDCIAKATAQQVVENQAELEKTKKQLEETNQKLKNQIK